MDVLPGLRKFFGSVRAPEILPSEPVLLSEQDFLARIAHLPSAEQQKKLWYWHLAQRQGIMEVEDRRD